MGSTIHAQGADGGVIALARPVTKPATLGVLPLAIILGIRIGRDIRTSSWAARKRARLTRLVACRIATDAVFAEARQAVCCAGACLSTLCQALAKTIANLVAGAGL